MKKAYILLVIFAYAPSACAMEDAKEQFKDKIMTRSLTRQLAETIQKEEANKQLADQIAEAKTIRDNAPRGYTKNMTALYCAFCKKTIPGVIAKTELGWHIRDMHKLCPECFIPCADSNELRTHNKEKHPEQIVELQ